MDILAINLNKYKGIESVVREDLTNSEVDYLFINGDKDCFEEFFSELKMGVLYVGFSPLSSSELAGFAALLSFLNNNEVYKIRYYEESETRPKVEPLVISLIDFFNSSDLTKTIFYTTSITDGSVSNSYSFVPEFKSVVYPYFEFNRLIYSLYTTSLGACQFKNMGKNLLRSLNNESISLSLARQLSNIDGKHPEFKALTLCLNYYLKLANKNEKNALVFYVALFLNISSFNKNRNEFAIAYLFLQRAIETALTHFFLSSGVLELNDYDRLCFKGELKPIQGVGDLIKEYFAIHSNPVLEKKVSKLNYIRNCSLLAHGLYIPSSDEYNELYDATKKMVENLFSSNDTSSFYKMSLTSLKPLSKEHIKSKIIDFFGKKNIKLKV